VRGKKGEITSTKKNVGFVEDNTGRILAIRARLPATQSIIVEIPAYAAKC
jgi:hypothetical protein